MLRIQFVKGMGSPVDRPVPDISVYGDGRVLTTAIDLAESPARDVVKDHRLTRTAYRRLYRDARLAGLTTSRTFHSKEQTADGGLTVVTFLADRRQHASTVQAGAGGVRVWMINRLARRLRALPRGDLLRPPVAYRPERMAIVAWRPAKDPSGDSPGSGTQAAPWPLRPLPAGRSATCTLLTGADAEAAARLAGSASTTAQWRSGPGLYTVIFRPLLPDETDCAAIIPKSP
ncbi:hypothetical protein [Actinomadura sp. WMMA1423]|uniref:hypothetical protein n=1 Tax=Actinomadura sp. WMMA1423 TaxID=2591108 RepID=UPI0011470770|nr:hypothetical protein [Actinomadura sp. WMMA1423]